MNKIIWEIQCHSSLPAYRYCKKCGEKRAFTCSGQFRVNAQQKHLDVWLIYKCPDCDTTWNASVCCRVSPIHSSGAFGRFLQKRRRSRLAIRNGQRFSRQERCTGRTSPVFYRRRQLFSKRIHRVGNHKQILFSRKGFRPCEGKAAAVTERI